MMGKIKSKVFDLLDKSEQNGLMERLVELFILVLIVMNVLAVIIDPSIRSESGKNILKCFENFSIVVFTLEYLMRLWIADIAYPEKKKWRARVSFVLSGMALIDLAAILPFYIPFLIPIDLRVLRMLRLFRLFRVLKVSRYTNALTAVYRVIKSKADQLASSVFVILVLIVMSSVLMYNVESAVQPDKFSDVFDAMWWAVATLTTVGYGDIYPVTALGRILSAIIAILGIGIVAIPTGIVASGFMEQVQHKSQDAQDRKTHCPYCGHSLDE